MEESALIIQQQTENGCPPNASIIPTHSGVKLNMTIRKTENIEKKQYEHCLTQIRKCDGKQSTITQITKFRMYPLVMRHNQPMDPVDKDSDKT